MTGSTNWPNTYDVVPAGSLTWEPPPSAPRSGNRPSRWSAVSAALRANPGEWARIPCADTKSGSAGLAATIRSGGSTAWKPKGAFEVIREGDNLWARYVGEAPHG